MDILVSTYQEALPYLKKIEKKRKIYLFLRRVTFGVLLYIFSCIGLLIIGGLSSIIFKFPSDRIMDQFQKTMLPDFIGLLPVPLTIAFIVTIFLYAFIQINQDKIFLCFLKTLNPDLNFNEKKEIAPQRLIDSGFFPNIQEEKSSFSGNGVVSGEIDDMIIQFTAGEVNNKVGMKLFMIPVLGAILTAFSFFYVSLKVSISKGTGIFPNRFKGLFFVADFYKNLNGFTIVLPDNYEKRLGFLVKPIQELKKNQGELVYLEDPRFEKEFVVYSTDQIESRYILTPSFMERILELKNTLDVPFMLSFRGSRMYVGINNQEGIFEVPLKKNVMNPTALEKPYRNLAFCLEIVKELKLNQQMWGKH